MDAAQNQQAKQDWLDFRRAREDELRRPYGWLTLQAFHWLPETPTELPGLPGRWSTDGEQAFCDADPGDQLVADGEPLAGRSAVTVAETGRIPWLRHGDREIELLRRGGRLAIRVRAQSSPERESFRGIPVYDYDPAWVIPARFTAYPPGRIADVGTHRPDLRQQLPALGELEFTAGGAPQRLVVTTIKAGPSIEFHDPTNDAETPAWRQLKFAEPDADGHVVLDFNRTINMWFAFTDHATCPRPSEGNTITVPVRAGERAAPPPPAATDPDRR
ncbi:hypothetical protein B0O41_0244 [Propionibacteriaceae bacterium ES.041]|nr:hypothetical protein B0O41_0244 [Propionibacteriaceae bacterium ES.041]